MKCIVCGYKSNKNQEVWYFRFPKEKARCKVWAERCGLNDLLEKFGAHRFFLSYKICSNHFKPKDIISEGNKKRLAPQAVPHIFSKKRNAKFISAINKANYKSKQNEPIKSISEVTNLKNLCRLCAKKNQNLIHIFSWRGKTLELEEKLKYFPLVIDTKDDLPLSICSECVSQVNNVHSFIIKCIKAEAKLKSQLEPNQEKSKACKSPEIIEIIEENTESVPKSVENVDELTVPNTPPVIKKKIPIITLDNDTPDTKENDTSATKENVSSDIRDDTPLPVKQNLPSGTEESTPSVIKDTPAPAQQVSMIVTQENADVKNNFLVTITENAPVPVITSVPLVVRETTFLVIAENVPLGMNPSNIPLGMNPNVPLGMNPNVPLGMNPNVSLAMNPNVPLTKNPNVPLVMKSNDHLDVKENAVLPVRNSTPLVTTKRNPAVTKNTFFAAKQNLPSAMKKNILLTTKENFPSAIKKNVFTASKQRAPSIIRDNASSVIKRHIPPVIKDSNPSVLIDFHTSVIRRHFSKTDSIDTVKTDENKKNEVPVNPSNSDTNECCELDNSIDTFQRVCVIKKLCDQYEYSGSSQQNQITKTIETEIPAQNLYNEIKYSCDICSETFMRIENLNLHMVTHFPRLDENQSFMSLNSDYRYFPDKSESIIRRKNLVHTCQICFKKFILAAFLKKHIEKYHYNSNLRSSPDIEPVNPMKKLEAKLQIKKSTLKCQFCDKVFANRQLCKSHEQCHTGKEPYLCEECGKNFKSCPALRKHMVLHSDKNVFNCKDCGKRFKKSDNYAINTRFHTKQYTGFAFK